MITVTIDKQQNKALRKHNLLKSKIQIKFRGSSPIINLDIPQMQSLLELLPFSVL
jgi:hypothetical protein